MSKVMPHIWPNKNTINIFIVRVSSYKSKSNNLMKMMGEALNSKVFKPTQVCCPSDIQVHLHNKCGLTSHYALLSVRSWRDVPCAGRWLLTCFRPEKQDSSLGEQGHLTKSDELLCKRQVMQGLASLLNKIQCHILKWVPEMVSASHPETSLRRQVT